MMKHLRAVGLVLAAGLVAFGLQNVAPAARAALWQWSTTAASNATADPTINWAEGMSPSSVNDSARAMMAATALWRNDLRGTTSTTGTATAYVLTSNQGGFTATAAGNGFMIGFKANNTNGSTPTINVDGAGAKPLRRISGANLEPGVIISGSIYQATYLNATDEWLLQSMRGPGIEVPIGAVIDWTAGGVPAGGNWINPEGQCISQTTYATYFALVGTTYGAGCGPGLFQVPDYRGRVLAHVDNGAGRLGCALIGCGVASVALSGFELPAHSHSFSGSGSVSVSGTTDSGGPSGHNHNYERAANTNATVKSGVDQGGIWLGTATLQTGLENSNLNHTHNFNGSGSASVSGTTGVTGFGAAFSIVQPTSYSYKILRIL